ncbi:hypothetical protein L6164_027476 [Bauhinia variegata]|uniref:Uncharacterized protein n=1 Tax=Bauhinia variegata TaxID=167791 RepID=A0ACB9LTN2_BAUVA|nr:hypothetical protein L6164_027476 [Bauhinia variegata]
MATLLPTQSMLPPYSSRYCYRFQNVNPPLPFIPSTGKSMARFDDRIGLSKNRNVKSHSPTLPGSGVDEAHFENFLKLPQNFGELVRLAFSDLLFVDFGFSFSVRVLLTDSHRQYVLDSGGADNAR